MHGFLIIIFQTTYHTETGPRDSGWTLRHSLGLHGSHIWNTRPIRLTVSITCFSFTISAGARAWPTIPGAEEATAWVHFLFTFLPANEDLRDLVRAFLEVTAGVEGLLEEDWETK